MAEDQLQGNSDPVQAAEQAGNALGVIATTLNGLSETVGRVERKVDRQSERMDVLTDATNHRLDDFREDMDRHRTEQAAALLAHQATVAAAIAAKADRKEFSPGAMLWAELKTNRALQAALSVVAVAMAPVVATNWAALMEQLRSVF